jgi:hypothetical protein
MLARQVSHTPPALVIFISMDKNISVLAPMAHACNSSYLGGRYQKYYRLKPAWANSLKDPI